VTSPVSSHSINPTMSSSLALQTAKLPDRAREDFDFWRTHLEPFLSMPKGVCKGLRELSRITGTPYKTILRKYYAAKKNGLEALIDRRLAGPSFWMIKKAKRISPSDAELVKFYCEKNQRSSRSAVKQLLRDWQCGRVRTKTAVNPDTGRPQGWSIDNLCRYAPSKFELKAVRIGRSAAKTHRPLVYTTRKGLWVGSHYMLDDMWHDCEVNSFAERQAGRPLELCSYDLSSARKVRWGIRVRTRRDD